MQNRRHGYCTALRIREAGRVIFCVPDMLIRRSTLADQEQVAAFIRETILVVNLADYSPEHVRIWSSVITAEMLRERFASIIQFVAEEQGEIVGVADLRTHMTEVDFLYIHKDYIRQGIGSALLKQIEETARQVGLAQLRVTSSVTARSFFERHGFSLTSQAQKTLQGKSFTVFVLQKPLNAQHA